MSRLASTPGERAVRATAWVVGLSLASLQAFTYRHAMKSDGMAYLDLADRLRWGQWWDAVSTYWNVGYPAALAAAFAAIRPGPYGEGSVVRAVNVVVFAATLLAFERLLSALRAAVTGDGAFVTDRATGPAFLALAYSAFLQVVLNMTPMEMVTPDLAVVAVVCAAAAAVVDVRRAGLGVAAGARLGGVLGVGVLVKTAVAPLVPVLLAVALLRAPDRRRAAAGVIAAALVTATIVAPVAGVISTKLGRPSLGESPRLITAWVLHGVPFLPDERDAAAGGFRLRHPAHVVLDRPRVYEFHGPGTVPVWFDPAYWLEGVRYPADPAKYVRRILLNMPSVLDTGRLLAVALAGGALLAALARARPPAGAVPAALALLIPAAFGGALYTAVAWLWRYVAAHALLTVAAAYALLAVPRAPRARRVAVVVAFVTSLLPLASLTSVVGGAALREARRPVAERHPEWRAAQALHGLGVRSGDQVAAVGDFLGWYWARLAGVQIVAGQIDGVDTFWKSPDDRARVVDAVRSTGVVALVARRPRDGGIPAGWTPLDTTDYVALRLRPRDPS